MAKPTDPIKLAAYRARQARNSANYRARQKAERLGVQPPAAARRQRPAHYRPPRVAGTAVERAQAVARAQRQSRAEIIANLPDVRNPRARLRPGEQTERKAADRKTKAGQKRQAEAIRERAAAERLQAIGRARKQQLRTELESGAQADRLQDAMSKQQQAVFQRLSDAIARASQQAVAILFEYAGGQNLYSAAIERILASPESRDVDEGLAMLELLAAQAERAAKMYAPSRIGRLTV